MEGERWIKLAGRYWVNLDNVAAVEERTRDRQSDYGGVVRVPIAIVHLRTPLVREGSPPAWQLLVENEDRLELERRLSLLAAGQPISAA